MSEKTEVTEKKANERPKFGPGARRGPGGGGPGGHMVAGEKAVNFLPSVKRLMGNLRHGSDIAKQRGEGWLARYGGTLSAEMLMPKVLETLEKDPEVYAATERFFNALDWITFRMTGNEVPDVRYRTPEELAAIAKQREEALARAKAEAEAKKAEEEARRAEEAAAKKAAAERAAAEKRAAEKKAEESKKKGSGR